MKIHEIIKQKKPLFSFEIFPPRRTGEREAILHTVEKLAEQKPDFISVTYGAAGSERSFETMEMTLNIQKKYGVSSIAHLTCVGATQNEMEETLDIMAEKGIENILMLRGDLPEGEKKSAFDKGFSYASDLVKFAKPRYDFSIGGACYPEGHLESRSATQDLFHLKNKVDAGTDFLISQLFFDNEKFYRFLHEARSIDINVPIMAGIMPVLNKRQIEKILKLSGAQLPKKFIRMIEKFEHNPQALQEAGIAYACEQIIDLLSSDVDGIHFYVLNQPHISDQLVKNISQVLKATQGNQSER